MARTATTNTSATKSPMGRSQVVWLALVASMTAVGGLLLASEGRRGGFAAPPAAVGLEPGRAPGIDAVLDTRTPLDRDRWNGVVIHHSASISGSPESISELHQEQGLRGLGYHFVIGNGRGLADGEIHVGYRWNAQSPGAHTIGPNADLYNRRAIGICLVGDGDRGPFTPAQLASLVRLVRVLQGELTIDDEQVLLHRDVAATASPGRLFPEAGFRARLDEPG